MAILGASWAVLGRRKAEMNSLCATPTPSFAAAVVISMLAAAMDRSLPLLLLCAQCERSAPGGARAGSAVVSSSALGQLPPSPYSVHTSLPDYSHGYLIERYHWARDLAP